MIKLAPLHAWLLVVVLQTASNGQVRKNLPKGKLCELKTVVADQPKLRKTQGSQKSDNVNSSIQDKAGNLWFGTTGEGLYQYDGRSFSQYTLTNGLNSNKITCLLEDKAGNLWIGTEAGVCLYDGKTWTKIPIPLPKDLPPNQHRSTHDVFSIMQDKRGKLWFATIDGVYVYDGKTFTPFVIKKGAGGFLSTNHNVERILEDKAGNLWFGGRTNAGVFRYDGQSITTYNVDGKEWAWPQLQDKQGNIWFSNWQGAYRYDGQSFIKLHDLSRAPVSPITRVIEDKNGTLWFGGGRRGLCRYDGKTVTCLTTKDGLPDDDVWSILEDRRGHLWIGTRNTGLSRYDGKTLIPFSPIDKAIGTNLFR